jgi:hypothetical protein
MQILPFEQEKAEKRFELEECIPLDIGAYTSGWNRGEPTNKKTRALELTS